MKAAQRRNPVTRTSALAIDGIALAAGVAVASSGAAPTGNAVIDTVVIIGGAGCVVWASGTAPWWALVVAAAGATALAANAMLVGVSTVALVLAVVIGSRRRNWAWVRALSAAMSLVVLIHQRAGGFFGLSAIFGVGIALFVAVLGMRRRPRTIRLFAMRALVGSIVFVVLATIGFAIGAMGARVPLRAGQADARAGLSMLESGDVTGAQAAFTRAAANFRSAVDSLDRLWTQPARLLPIVAQNRNGAESLAAAASTAMESIAGLTSHLDLKAIQMTHGRIDLDAVRAFEQPLTELQNVLDQLGRQAPGPWQAAVLQRAVADLDREVGTQSTRTSELLRTVRVLPPMLGSDRPRVYFVAFCTPAEARGGLGFMGNFAELTATNGTLTMTRFGRTSTDLDPSGEHRRRLTGLNEFASMYGGYGFTSNAGGTAADDIWLDVTMSPDFPTTADVISQLYPQTGGQHLDGVIAIDPDALASMLRITGPISVAGVDTPLTVDNARQYLLLDQYRNTSNANRIDTLEALARTMTSMLIAGPLPSPIELGQILSPLAADRHLQAWSANDDEEALFTQFHADGSLPTLNGRDGIGMTFDNGVGNKIDNYLDVALAYDPAIRTSSGSPSATVTLTNRAPATGLPSYVIGNVVGLPAGTNRTLFTLYSARTVRVAMLDGVPLSMTPGQERSWNTSSSFIDLAPGQSRTLKVTLDGSNELAAGPPVIVAPALVNPAAITIVSRP